MRLAPVLITPETSGWYKRFTIYFDFELVFSIKSYGSNVFTIKHFIGMSKLPIDHTFMESLNKGYPCDLYQLK